MDFLLFESIVRCDEYESVSPIMLRVADYSVINQNKYVQNYENVAQFDYMARGS